MNTNIANQDKNEYFNLKTGAFLFIIVLIAYLPAFRGGYVWDDDTNITNNPLLRTGEGLVKIWTQPKLIPQGHYWPIIYTSFWIEYQIWGAKPYGYHLINIILHAINVLLLWILLRRLAIPGALLAAAIFALHPVHVESVAWITERKNVLSAMFYLIAFLYYMKFEENGHRKDYIVSLIIFVCALLSKTITVSLPIAILLYLYWKRDKLSIKDFINTVPFFAAAFIITLLCLWVYKSTYPVESTLSLLDKFIVAGWSLWFYAWKLLLPVNLIAIYPRWNIDPSALWQYIFSIGFFVVIIALWFLKNKIGKGSLAAVLFFAITLAPLLNIIDQPAYTEMTFVNDHAQYLPSIGLIVLFAASMVKLKNRYMNEKTGIAGGVILILILGIITWQHAGLYKDMETLFRHSLAKNPNAWAAHNNLGLALEQKGKYDEAIIHFKEALKLKPDFAKAHYNLGNVYSDINQYEQAVIHYKEAIKYDPHYTMAINNLGIAYASRNNFNDAIKAYKKVLEIDPENFDAYNNLGNALAQAGEYDEAYKAFSKALELQPGNLDIRYNMANTFILQGKINEAVSEYRKALEINPNNIVSVLKLAWFLATYENSIPQEEREESLILAKKAQELIGNREHPIVLDTLAAAYGAVGRFDDAIKTAEKALELAAKGNNEKLAGDITKRLELYKKGLPYREKQP